MNRLALVLSFLLVLPVSFAFADTNITASGDATIQTSSGLQVGEQDSVEASSGPTAKGEDGRTARGSDELGATSSERAAAQEEMNESSSENSNEQASTSEENMGEQHRSVVASVVHSLLADSERDDGIGADVRAVAESQQESASTTAEAIAKVEARGKFMSILFGTDWKNVGILRSELAKTDADAARLQTAIGSTTDASLKANLTAQLDAIKAEQAKIAAFVDAEEHSFSLFGWFTKLFVSADTSASATTTAQ